MEYPSGHHSHTHHHRRRDDDEDDYPPPNTAPPPFSQDQNDFAPPAHFQNPRPQYFPSNEYPPPPPAHQTHGYQNQGFDSPGDYPPPPPVTHISHEQNEFRDPRPDYFPSNEYAPPPPPIHQTHGYQNQGFDSPGDYLPPPPPVTHISHEESETQQHHSYKPHMPSFVHHMSHQSDSVPGLDLSNKPTFKVYCKAEPNFRLTIRQGTVVLAPADPSDEFQNWYKDEKYSTRVKDEEGCPCFALVNKASGQAMKHSIGASHPVELISYNGDVLDQSILWTESKDLGDAYRAVRMVNNVRLNLDAFHGDDKSGGVRDGTTIVLWQWNKGNNQRWRITPH